MAKKDFAIRKRQMLKKAHQTMLIVVAVASVFVGAAMVLNWFLVKRVFFNQRVISAQNETISNLAKNNKTIVELDKQVRVLKTNKLLADKKAYPSQTPLQVILDALPDRANTPALGESLRRSILNVPNIVIDQMSLTKTEDETGSEFVGQGGASYNEEYDDIKEPPIYFRVKITGTAMGLNQVLKNIENSIRPIFVDKIKFESSNKTVDNKGNAIPAEEHKHWLTITARSFYSYGIKAEMKEKTIKEGDNKKAVKKKTGVKGAKNEKK